jgi:hypothetical protein
MRFSRVVLEIKPMNPAELWMKSSRVADEI